MTSNKTSVSGRVLSIVFGILAIFSVTGKRLGLKDIPIILGSYKMERYSLFEIRDFLDRFNFYVQNDTVETYSILLLLMTTVVILLISITILTSLKGTKPAKVMSVLSIISAVILSGAVIRFVIKTNLYVEDNTYGGVESLLELTAKPWLLIVFTTAQRLFLNIKAKNMSTTTNTYINTTKQCSHCGAFLTTNALFCNKCGAKVQQTNNAPIFCTTCGNPTTTGAEFCNNGGAPLK